MTTITVKEKEEYETKNKTRQMTIYDSRTTTKNESFLLHFREFLALAMKKMMLPHI